MVLTEGILVGILTLELRQKHFGQTDWTDPSGYSVRQVIFGWLKHCIMGGSTKLVINLCLRLVRRRYKGYCYATPLLLWDRVNNRSNGIVNRVSSVEGKLGNQYGEKRFILHPSDCSYGHDKF